MDDAFNDAFGRSECVASNVKAKNKVLVLHRALLNRYIVHSPTNAIFITLGKV